MTMIDDATKTARPPHTASLENDPSAANWVQSNVTAPQQAEPGRRISLYRRVISRSK